MNQDVNDPLVSSTYRDSATEAAPDTLNQSVLREARQQATSGGLYARSIFWLRPMAWAATIGLCLAIVVDLNDVPRPEPGMLPAPAATRADTRSPAAAREDLQEGDLLEEIVVEPESDAAKETPVVGDSNTLQRARKSVDEEGRVTLSNIPQLEKAEALAAESVPAADDARTDTLSFEVAAAVEMPCDAEARKTPQSWLECIEGLETDGLDELAAWQREELQAAFPEFELP